MTEGERRWRDRATMLAAVARNLLHMHGDLLHRLVKAQGYDSRTEERALEENLKCVAYWESMISVFLGEGDDV